jgi:predicted deacylase
VRLMRPGSVIIALCVAIPTTAGEWDDCEPAIDLVGPVPEEYYSYSEVVSELARLAYLRPDICHLGVAGHSQELGLPIPVVTFARDPEARNRPCVMFTGAIHAREVPSVVTTIALCRRIVQGDGVDPLITNLLDGIRIVVIPMINVDGVSYIFDENLSSPWWRKNLRDNNGWGFSPDSDGVDLNRNFDRFWEFGDSNPTSWYYRGEAPFSEAEACAVRDVARTELPSFGITYHTYDEAVYYPRTVGGQFTPDDDLYTAIAWGLANRLTRHNGSVYFTARQSRKGFSSHWLYSAVGCFDYTMEIGTEHVPDFETAKQDAVQHVEAALWLCDAARRIGVTGTVADSLTGETVECEVSVIGRESSGDLPRRNDPETGFYHRPIPPGSHVFSFTAEGYEMLVDTVLVLAGTTATHNVRLVPSVVAMSGATTPRPTPLRVHPNPFNSVATFLFYLPTDARASVQVFDLLGRKVDTPTDGWFTAGDHRVVWDASLLASGVYLIRFTSGETTSAIRTVLLK